MTRSVESHCASAPKCAAAQLHWMSAPVLRGAPYVPSALAPRQCASAPALL
jgi:hypothetical protein